MTFMSIHWSSEEEAAIAELATSKALSETAVIRQALRLYQMVHHRQQAGEKMSFSGDEQRAREFAGPAFVNDPQMGKAT